MQFIFCSALIVASGSQLSKYGDVIAEKTGLGRAWIGLVLMASITSLPELITGVSSVAIVGAPDIALGDIMGSCIYNLAILAILDVMNGHKPIFFKADKGHLLSAGFGVALMGVVLVSIMVGGSFPGLAHVGLYTPVIIVVYLIGVRAVYVYEKTAIKEFVEEVVEAGHYADITLKKAWTMYVVNALVIVFAATWLPFVAEGIAEMTGLGNSFVGTVFVAMTTSLPEVVVSITAVRIGAQDMAIANMLGSNMFNVLVLAVDDMFYTAGPLFSHISTNHVVTGIMAVIMTAVVVVGLTYPSDRKSFGRVGWDSLTLFFLWGLTIYIFYVLSVA
ncbi:MAG: sodium:calcium antiporter [Thermodesulfobacteriota bacterium]